MKAQSIGIPPHFISKITSGDILHDQVVIHIILGPVLELDHVAAMDGRMDLDLILGLSFQIAIMAILILDFSLLTTFDSQQ
jgi:hypothetical protein